jgi:hypothetical protein
VAIPSLTYSYQNLHQFHKNGAECWYAIQNHGSLQQ